MTTSNGYEIHAYMRIQNPVGTDACGSEFMPLGTSAGSTLKPTDIY